jgi:hypothetical protein
MLFKIKIYHQFIIHNHKWEHQELNILISRIKDFQIQVHS